MNIILIKPEEERAFHRQDYRYQHIKKILKSKEGDTLEAGIVGGKMGVLTIKKISSHKINFEFTPDKESRPPLPVYMIIGTPRPPVAKRLIKDLGSWPVKEIHFVSTDLGEKSYLKSNLWLKEEYHFAQLEGASQGKTTYIPPIHRHNNVYSAAHSFTADGSGLGILFHNEVSLPRINGTFSKDHNLWLAIGPERGWSEKERDFLISKGFIPHQMGDSVLRTEVACHCALGIMVNRIE